MASPTFIQSSRVGRSIFQLRGDVIEITQTILGRRQETRIPIKTLSRDYDRIARRMPQLFVIPLVLCIPCFWVIDYILGQKEVPHEFAIYPGLFMLALVVAAMRGVPRIDRFQFYDYWKKPIFHIIREKKQGEECDAFVRELLERIECGENGRSISDHKTELEGVSDGLFQVQVGEHRWKASVLLGVFSAGLPWFDQLARLIGNLQFMLVFGSTVGGLVFCVLSFQSKERLRYLSVFGAALSLIAPLIYKTGFYLV